MRQRVQRSQRDHSCVSLAERLLSSGGIPASSAAPSSDADDDDDDDDDDATDLSVALASSSIGSASEDDEGDDVFGGCSLDDGPTSASSVDSESRTRGS